MSSLKIIMTIRVLNYLNIDHRARLSLIGFLKMQTFLSKSLNKLLS